jgi:tetratricopeptide (TPR) repeat protein
LLGRFLDGQEAAVTAGTVSDRMMILTERIVSSMFPPRRKLIAALTLVLGASATGVALFRMAAPGPASTNSAPPTARAEATNSAPPAASPEAPADAGRLVLTPGDADRLALAIVCRSFPDPSQRAHELVNLGEAEARRGDAAAAKMTLCLAVEAAVSIRPFGHYVYPNLPHPIYRIAAAQAELGDDDAARRTLLAAAERIGAEEDGDQIQQWDQFVDWEFRISGRVSPETVASYQRCLEHAPEYLLFYVLTTEVKLQAASGDPKGAIREVREGAEFAGSEHNERLRQSGYQGARLRIAALLAILSVVRRGDPVAEEVLEEVKKVVADQPVPAGGRDSRSQDLLALARQEVRLGRFADAVALAGSMKMTDIPGKSDQAQTFAEIAKAQARAGDPEGAVASAREAIAICDTIPGDRIYLSLHGQAVDALIEAGALADVRKLAETMGPRDRSMLRSQIAEASFAAGDDATAVEYLKQNLHAYEEERASAEKLPLPAKGAPDWRNYEIAEASHQIALLQARLGDLPAALATVATITDASKRDAALRGMAIVRASEGDLASARDLVARIVSPKERGYAWIRIACSLPGPRTGKRGSAASS